MAIAFDATSSGSSTGSTTLTVAHTCTGANRLLLCYIASTAADNVTGVTYNGVAMTEAVKAANSFAGGEVYIYYLIAPATGANNIVVTKTGTTGTLAMLSASYTGALQSGQPDSTSSGYTGTRPNSWSQTVVAGNSWVFVGEMCNGTPTAGTNTYLRLNTSIVGQEGIFDSNAALASGSTSFSVTSSIATDIMRISITFAPFPEAFSRSLSDSMMNDASRLTTIARAQVLARTLSDAIMNGATRLATVSRGFFRTLSDSMMNAVSRLATIAFSGFYSRWVNQSKNSASFSNQAKNSSSWTDAVKSSSSWTNQDKHN